MSEKRAYVVFKEGIQRPGDRIDRIENCCVDGMPDVNVCLSGVESWLEIKSPLEPKGKSTPLFGSNHRLSQDQKNWILRQRRAGGRAFILIMTDVRWMLMKAAHADALNEMTVDELVDNSAWMTMRPVREREQWQSLRDALTRK